MAKSKISGKQVNCRLYECEECHERRMVRWVELNRASRPKCMGCGSIRLELVSDEAKKDAQRLQEQRLIGSGGSLELAGHVANNRHRLAT